MGFQAAVRSPRHLPLAKPSSLYHPREGLAPAQAPWWVCRSCVETPLQRAFTHPLPLLPGTPRVFPPESSQWGVPGPGHTVPTMWGTGRLCPWPDVLGEKSVASSLQALESMGHCHPHRARPGQEGCVVD